jgi:hypothetical protein
MNASESLASDISLLLVNHEGIVLDAHESACAALGWAREEIVNREMSELFEYGADLVLGHFAQAANSGDTGESFSVSTLVRRRDQTHFPATAVVKYLAELNCFAVTFDDLPSDVMEAAPLVAASGTDLGIETNDIPEMVFQRVQPPEAAPMEATAIPVVTPDEEVHANGNGNGHAKGNGNCNGDGNGHAPRFRNIFLSERPPAEEEPQVANEAKAPSGKPDIEALLEAEQQERKRLEARVVSLNDQLQQLHVQLKSNLEAESIYHKRLADNEEFVRRAQQGKEAAEVLFREEQQKRERVEKELADLKASFEKKQAEQNAVHREWLAKLDASLANLKESDARLEKDIAARRGIDVTLQMLRQDFPQA